MVCQVTKTDILKEVEKLVDNQSKTQQPKMDTPITRYEEIKKERTPIGKGQMVIGGIPWDVHSLESYILRVSPLEMKTLLRYDAIRNVELVLNNQRPKDLNKNEFNYSIIIWIIIIIAIIGFLVLFGPKIIAFVSQMAGGVV